MRGTICPDVFPGLLSYCHGITLNRSLPLPSILFTLYYTRIVQSFRDAADILSYNIIAKSLINKQMFIQGVSEMGQHCRACGFIGR